MKAPPPSGKQSQRLEVELVKREEVTQRTDVNEKAGPADGIGVVERRKKQEERTRWAGQEVLAEQLRHARQGTQEIWMKRSLNEPSVQSFRNQWQAALRTRAVARVLRPGGGGKHDARRRPAGCGERAVRPADMWASSPLPLLLLCLLLAALLGCARAAQAAQAAPGTGAGADANALPLDQRFFLKQIFDKYGHDGIMTFEVVI
ncbi:Protein of unknown function [Gryllus bimaculatus]|nr:Protein of unknown function [Gryllus bimaculatus]